MTDDDRRWPPKDPDEILDYMIDWSDALASLPASPDDAITGVPTWILAPAGELAQPRPATNTGTTTTIWLGGGVAGSTYRVTCRVETVQGRTMEVTKELWVRDSGM
ncbi:hypothetical protein FHP25_31295 [Vineibacter terrae]|uniref:Ig-like domain-containing protein n=1 Tax=Vineibacter terrae TaxID=2586908 RepID=A0A5C8PCA7_9HYPH|nr:hypothetical protein [Vineibacter terrae]TXL71196.1 hypothetical protein FHP25_31295 [Vineibacter terrae]